TPGRPLSTRSTVANETPASRATSCTVARRTSSPSLTIIPLALVVTADLSAAAAPVNIFRKWGFSPRPEPDIQGWARNGGGKRMGISAVAFGEHDGQRVDQ